jgi:Ca2+-binding RTX toxin-like protein
MRWTSSDRIAGTCRWLCPYMGTERLARPSPASTLRLVKRLGRGFVVAAAALGAVFALGIGAGEEEEDPRCHGRRATIVGTDGADVLHGTPSRDVIWAGGGDDEAFGSLGNDLVCGGPGDDLVHGGRGNDVVDGGPGTDRVVGDLGDDKVVGGPGEGDDVAGSLGIDTLNGGPGDFDLVHGDYGYDRMDGGPGKGDIASFATDPGAGRRGGGGVWVSLRKHRARGDGHDRLFRLESIEGSAFADRLVGNGRANVIDGGPGNDKIRGGGGADELNGGQGTDRCSGAKGHTTSCGREARPKGSAYVELDATPGGGGGLEVVGGRGRDQIAVSFDADSQSFTVSAAGELATGAGCGRPAGVATQAVCAAEGPARWLMVDLGPGSDSLQVEGSLEAVGSVRLAGGPGNDTIHGGPEADLIESGPGSDHLYGGAGSDGLVGGLPGPTYLYGGANGDLLAAGGGCAGGAIVGGPGRDDASFAETQAHRGTLYVSLAAHAAWIDVVRGCNHVRLSPTNEDIEGSFDYDVLIGDSGPNAMLGQPGKDRFYGRGGDDVVDARDGVRDKAIQCGRRGQPEGLALADPFDPSPEYCAKVTRGAPVPGLNNSG